MSQSFLSSVPIFLKGPLLLGALLIFSMPFALAAPSECDAVFGQTIYKEPIEKTIRNLAEMKISLDIAQSRGGTSPATTALIANIHQREKELVEYLEKHQIMTRAQLIQRIMQEISKTQNESHKDQQQKKELEEESHKRTKQEKEFTIAVIDGNYAIFNRIEPGPFRMDKAGTQINVRFEAPFDMMATPTTQIIWKKVAQLANSSFPEKYQIVEEPSKFKGDTLPVEGITFPDVEIWLRALNDLSKAGNPHLVEIIPSHQKGDFYRLPGNVEWDFVLTARGLRQDTYHYGNDRSQMPDFAWYRENSDSTQPVAKKPPIYVDGKEVYDMIGNVWEFVKDPYHAPEWGKKDVPYYTIKGGSWKTLDSDLHVGRRFYVIGNKAGPDIGFRMVRESR